MRHPRKPACHLPCHFLRILNDPLGGVSELEKAQLRGGLGSAAMPKLVIGQHRKPLLRQILGKIRIALVVFRHPVQ